MFLTQYIDASNRSMKLDRNRLFFFLSIRSNAICLAVINLPNI